MKGEGVRETYAPFGVFALMVPVANAAVGQNWLPTLIAGLAACLFCGWVGGVEAELPSWIRAVRIAVTGLLAAAFLSETHLCWPDSGAAYVVPLVLLALAAYAVGKGRMYAIRGSNVLRFGVYFVLGVMFLSAVRSIRIDALRPAADYPASKLVAVLLLPLLSRRKGNSLPFILTALAAAIVTAGTRAADLFTFSRGLSVHGIAEHIESLTACAMTAGYYALLVYLLDTVVTEQIQIRGRENGWFLLIFAAAAYAAYLGMPGDLWKVLAVCEVLLWGIVPLIWRWKKNLQKNEKRC